MKIKIDRKTFARALAEVAPFAPQKAPIAILKNAKITTKDNRMKIEANDVQCAMTKYIDVIECDQDGTFLIDIAELNKFVSKTKGDSLEIEIDGNTIHITHSKGSAEFQSCDASDFPSFKMPDDEVKEINLETRFLAEAISNGKGFVASDILRPQMCAVYAYIKDSEFGYCATDTRKMIHGHILLDDADGVDVSWLIMTPVFSALLNSCKTADVAKIQITGSHVSYRIGNVIIHTLQAKGSYPNFKRVIPQTWSMECAVDKDELTETLNRVSLFCDNTQCVKFGISRMDMSVSVDNLDYMKSAKENLTHSGCDGEIKIGVNASNAIASVNVFGGKEILMRMTDESKPILFQQQGNDCLQVIAMPMALNS